MIQQVHFQIRYFIPKAVVSFKTNFLNTKFSISFQVIQYKDKSKKKLFLIMQHNMSDVPSLLALDVLAIAEII